MSEALGDDPRPDVKTWRGPPFPPVDDPIAATEKLEAITGPGVGVGHDVAPFGGDRDAAPESADRIGAGRGSRNRLRNLQNACARCRAVARECGSAILYTVAG